jgi:3-hydroxyisobutyrate dehydrogenase-like beta-hydroxyacid dehydrogenase
VTPPSRIALIGFGEVGQTLTADLRHQAAIELIAWDIQFVDLLSSPYQRAREAGVQIAASASEAAAGAAVIISAVTTANCLAAAESVVPALSGNAAFLLDLNSVAPSVKQQAARVIDAHGCRYIEAAVMAPIQPRGLATAMLLGGPHAEAFLPVARALGLSAAQVYSPIVGPASAAKLCRSVIIKGLEALLTESLLAARHYGVEAAVLASLSDLLPNPDWPAQAHYMLTRSLLHGRRRSEEMQYVAQTVAEAGIDPWMSEASVHRQAWAGAHAAAAAATGDSLSQLLDSLMQSPSTGEVHAC